LAAVEIIAYAVCKFSTGATIDATGKVPRVRKSAELPKGTVHIIRPGGEVQRTECSAGLLPELLRAVIPVLGAAHTA
jgi:hypothetical protein